MLGFNPLVVIATLKMIENVYETIQNAIKTQGQEGFINGMALQWEDENAKEFFDKTVKPAFEEVIKKIDENFDAIHRGINEAASVWARRTRGIFTKTFLSRITPVIDVSCIKEVFENGDKGIKDDQNTLDVLAKLTLLGNTIDNALTTAMTSIKNSPFLGADQEQYLIGLLMKNKEIINGLIETLKTGLDTAVKNTISEYKLTGGAVSNAFNVNN